MDDSEDEGLTLSIEKLLLGMGDAEFNRCCTLMGVDDPENFREHLKGDVLKLEAALLKLEAKLRRREN